MKQSDRWLVAAFLAGLLVMMSTGRASTRCDSDASISTAVEASGADAQQARERGSR